MYISNQLTLKFKKGLCNQVIILLHSLNEFSLIYKQQKITQVLNEIAQTGMFPLYIMFCIIGRQYGCFESFPFVQIFLFSSARSRDFDGMLSAGLPVSMYTTTTPIDMF